MEEEEIGSMPEVEMSSPSPEPEPGRSGDVLDEYSVFFSETSDRFDIVSNSSPTALKF